MIEMADIQLTFPKTIHVAFYGAPVFGSYYIKHNFTLEDWSRIMEMLCQLGQKKNLCIWREKDWRIIINDSETKLYINNDHISLENIHMEHKHVFNMLLGTPIKFQPFEDSDLKLTQSLIKGIDKHTRYYQDQLKKAGILCTKQIPIFVCLPTGCFGYIGDYPIVKFMFTD